MQQAIETKISPLWALEPIDTEMHGLGAAKEVLILSRDDATRFTALDVAREEYRMEEAADRLYERVRTQSRGPPGSTNNEQPATSATISSVM